MKYRGTHYERVQQLPPPHFTTTTQEEQIAKIYLYIYRTSNDGNQLYTSTDPEFSNKNTPVWTARHIGGPVIHRRAGSKVEAQDR